MRAPTSHKTGDLTANAKTADAQPCDPKAVQAATEDTAADAKADDAKALDSAHTSAAEAKAADSRVAAAKDAEVLTFHEEIWTCCCGEFWPSPKPKTDLLHNATTTHMGSRVLIGQIPPEWHEGPAGASRLKN